MHSVRALTRQRRKRRQRERLEQREQVERQRERRPLDEEAESEEQPAVGSPFRGVDAGEKEKVAAIADQILSDIERLGFTDTLMTWGAEPQLELTRRVQKAKRRLLKASIGQVSNMRRAALHLAEYLESNEMSETCSKVVAADTLIDSLEEYDDSARAKAKVRAAKRAAKNLPPRRNDRGGATATMPIFRAGLACDGLYPDPPVSV